MLTLSSPLQTAASHSPPPRRGSKGAKTAAGSVTPTTSVTTQPLRARFLQHMRCNRLTRRDMHLLGITAADFSIRCLSNTTSSATACRWEREIIVARRTLSPAGYNVLRSAPASDSRFWAMLHSGSL
jgi:hypothetical protein